MLASLAVLGSVTTLLLKPGEVGRFLGADGAMFAAVVMLTTPLGFLVMRESSLTTTYSDGSGPLVAALGGLLAVVGATLWLFDTPYTARTPLKPKVNRARVVIAGFCVLWAFLSGLAAWTFDQRQDTVITPEIQAALDDVIRCRSRDPGELSPDDPNYLSAAEAGAEIGRLNASARQDETIYDNFNNDGPGLGIYAILLAAVGFLASLPAAGVFGLDEQKRWRWSVVVAGLGIGMLALAGSRSSSASSGSPTRTSFPAQERSCTSQQVRSLLRPHAQPWRSSVGPASSQVKRSSPTIWPMRPTRRRSRLPEFSTHGESPDDGVTTMLDQIFARSLRSARGIHNHPGRGTQ